MYTMVGTPCVILVEAVTNIAVDCTPSFSSFPSPVHIAVRILNSGLHPTIADMAVSPRELKMTRSLLSRFYMPRTNIKAFFIPWRL